MERVTLGRYPDIKTEQARTKASVLNGAIADGVNPGELKRAEKTKLSFAELFANYLEQHSKPNKRTWRGDEQQYRDYLAPRLAKKRISTITQDDIESIHSAITRNGHPTLANRVKALASSIFAWAIYKRYTDLNPAKGVKLNREKARDRFLQADELPALFKSLADEPNTLFRDFFLLALLTGARRSNVLKMRWEDLDLEEGIWLIKKTKNGDPLRVPLVPEALEILKSNKQNDNEQRGFVFPSNNEHSAIGHISGERKAWLRILKRAGLKDLKIHDLRRTLGSWQARTGASLLIIGKSLGHKSSAATQIYARLDTDPVRQAMTAATSAIMTAGEVKRSANVIQLADTGS